MAFRSILFTPATRLDRLPKALAAGPDWVALDLEDGVGPVDRDAARQALSAFIAGGADGTAHRIAVRINAPATGDGARDLVMLRDWADGPGMVIVPKVEAAADVAEVKAATASWSRPPVILVTLETAAGVADADAILRGLAGDVAVAYGSADHMAEVGGTMDAPSLAYSRGRIVNAAALARIPAMDGVWLDFRDRDGLVGDARLARSMGFAGKLAIHPDQIAPINAAFSPSESELATARAMLDAAEKSGGGAFAFAGKMVDAPVLARARRMVEWSKERK